MDSRSLGDTTALIYSFITLQLSRFEDFCSSSSCLSNTTVIGKCILLVSSSIENLSYPASCSHVGNTGALHPWESLTTVCAGTFCPSYLPCYIVLLVTYQVTGWIRYTPRSCFCQRACGLIGYLAPAWSSMRRIFQEHITFIYSEEENIAGEFSKKISIILNKQIIFKAMQNNKYNHAESFFVWLQPASDVRA